MDHVSTVTLIGQTPTRDDIGQEVMTDTRSTVYCTVLSVSRAEWSAARQRSLEPVTVLKVFCFDYHGEAVAEFEGKGARYIAPMRKVTTSRCILVRE